MLKVVFLLRFPFKIAAGPVLMHYAHKNGVFTSLAFRSTNIMKFIIIHKIMRTENPFYSKCTVYFWEVCIALPT